MHSMDRELTPGDQDGEPESPPVRRLSAKASGPGAAKLTEAEIEAAEAEAEAWARRCNSC